MKKLCTMFLRVFAWMVALLPVQVYATGGCQTHPERPECRTETPSQPVTATGNGYGGQASAGAAANAIAGALAQNDAQAASNLWASVSPSLRNEVMTMVNNDPRMTNSLRANFQDAINNRNSVEVNTGGASATGNGSGNQTQITYQSIQRGSLSLSSILAPPSQGDVKPGEWSQCHSRFQVPKDEKGRELPFETFENNARTAVVFGLLSAKDRVQTIVGPLPAFDHVKPYREVTYELGSILARELNATRGYVLLGHKHMIVAGVVATSGGSKMTLQRGNSGDLGDFGNTSGNGIPQVGAVIMECELDKGVIKHVPVGPQPTPSVSPNTSGSSVSKAEIDGLKAELDAVKRELVNRPKLEAVEGDVAIWEPYFRATKPFTPLQLREWRIKNCGADVPCVLDFRKKQQSVLTGIGSKDGSAQVEKKKK